MFNQGQEHWVRGYHSERHCRTHISLNDNKGYLNRKSPSQGFSTVVRMIYEWKQQMGSIEVGKRATLLQIKCFEFFSLLVKTLQNIISFAKTGLYSHSVAIYLL